MIKNILFVEELKNGRKFYGKTGVGTPLMPTKQKILIYTTAGSLVGLKKVIEELFFQTT
ncbi:hypothetical protein Sarmat_00796 [Rickettsiales endosymbiont of Paramecium tredecaurelia]|uniref:hypothetical protein n=1 Tax=Candidatus Sarmatiella mevalonica TaxID=2770581 RepID=UPI00192109C1|nr:hypothetical protein [Candidatus Sarmatiella mevalonica]MBL3284936.1 hypothetical protein [Candidatus Sarmatiella mevalonica]